MDVLRSLASTFVRPYYTPMTDDIHLDMLELLGDAIEWFNEVVFDFLKTAVHELRLEPYIESTIDAMCLLFDSHRELVLQSRSVESSLSEDFCKLARERPFVRIASEESQRFP